MIAVQWLVRNFELWTTIAGIVQVAGKPSFLKVLADIEEQKHPLINAMMGEMVPSVCTEDDNVIATTLHQTFRHRNICLDFIRIDDFAYLVAHYT